MSNRRYMFYGVVVFVCMLFVACAENSAGSGDGHNPRDVRQGPRSGDEDDQEEHKTWQQRLNAGAATYSEHHSVLCDTTNSCPDVLDLAGEPVSRICADNGWRNFLEATFYHYAHGLGGARSSEVLSAWSRHVNAQPVEVQVDYLERVLDYTQCLVLYREHCADAQDVHRICHAEGLRVHAIPSDVEQDAMRHIYERLPEYVDGCIDECIDAGEQPIDCDDVSAGTKEPEDAAQTCARACAGYVTETTQLFWFYLTEDPELSHELGVEVATCEATYASTCDADLGAWCAELVDALFDTLIYD